MISENELFGVHRTCVVCYNNKQGEEKAFQLHVF